MSRVMMPGKQNGTASALGSIGTVAGGVVGGIFGGPAGAAGGASLGGSIGSGIGGLAGGGGQAPGAVESKSNDSAMARRMQSQDPGLELKQADQALAQLPPSYQEQYGPMIRRARMLDEQQRGVA